MKKTIPIWGLLMLLLISAAVGWFVYQSRVKKTLPVHRLPTETEPPMHSQSEKKGSVAAYGSNPDGDIDKISLTTSEGNIWLHFPPHAARSIKEAAPINSFIEVIMDQGGPGGHRSDPVFELRYLKNQSAKTEIDLSQFPAPAPRTGFEVEVKGNGLQELAGEPGHSGNFVLSGKLISLPPHMARDLFHSLKQAKTIVVKGYMRDSTEGFLSASGMPVVKASSIQLDDVIYKIR